MSVLCDLPLSKPWASFIGKAAIRALYNELSLYPKPGLVSFVDNGAHDDMDAATFMRGIFALRHYFKAITEAGASGSPFPVLQHRELRRSGGYFGRREASTRIAAASFASGFSRRRPVGGVIVVLAATPRLSRTPSPRCGATISQLPAAQAPIAKHPGDRAVQLYGARGARAEALLGFPTLLRVALPTLHSTYIRLGCWERARVQSLFAAMAVLQDTNLLHRGGMEGLRFVQADARDFLDRGGVYSPACATALSLSMAIASPSICHPVGPPTFLARPAFFIELRE